MLVAACVLAALLRRDFRKAFVWAAAAIPTLCWYVYIYQVLPRYVGGARLVPGWVIPKPSFGLLLRAIDPPHYPLPAALEAIARGLDVVALIAVLAAAVMAALRLRATPKGALRILLLLQLVLFLATTSKHFWDTPFGYARPFAPLFVLLLAAAGKQLGTTAVVRAACLAALIDLRLGTEINSQVLGVARWFIH
jgi:hypothetical protein